jgi:hypothetical protein
MPTYDFVIEGTIIDAPDEQQARNFLRIRLQQGAHPSGQDRVTFRSVLNADIREHQA